MPRVQGAGRWITPGPWQHPQLLRGQGCFWALPEALLHALVVLQLPLDALKLSLQVAVAQGNRTMSLILTTLPAGPRLKGGDPGAGSGPSARCADSPQVHTCHFGARPTCEVPRKEQTGVGDTGQG